MEDMTRSSRCLCRIRLGRVQISNETDKTIAKLVYSSLYRQFLSPNNATLETQGAFAGTTSPYFDGLYCSWDTFRTFYPMLSLTSPEDYANIVENYIDGWRKLGQVPECRANNVPGLTQGEFCCRINRYASDTDHHLLASSPYLGGSDVSVLNLRSLPLQADYLSFVYKRAPTF
jgi:putative alpha-1,2-mannosidase